MNLDETGVPTNFKSYTEAQTEIQNVSWHTDVRYTSLNLHLAFEEFLDTVNISPETKKINDFLMCTV
jgi:hypothetical protein